MASHHHISSFLHFFISKRLVWLSLVILILILLNPLTSLDLALVSLFLLILGHIVLREKLLLVFLLLRPTVDYWRDLPLFTYRDTTLNVTDAIALLFFLWSLWMLWQYRRQWQHLPLTLVFINLIGLMSVSALWSVTPATTIIETVKFFNLAMFFWLGYGFVKNRRITLSELTLAIFASAIVPGLLALAQMFTGAGLATFGLRGRIYGTLGHPNVLAFLMLSLIILHTQYSVIEPTDFWKKNHVLRLALYALLSILLLLTYTRVTLIGLVIFLLIIGLAKYRRLLAGLAVGISAFYLIFFPLNDWLINHANYSLTRLPVIGRLTARNDDADSIGWRLSLARETLPIIQARPWLGYGFGAFPTVWSENRGARHFWDDSAEAHNDYLRVVLELGVVGLLLYIMLLLGLLISTGKKLQEIKINSNKLKINYTKLQKTNFLKFFLILFNFFQFKSDRGEAKYLHVFAWILIFVVMSLSDNLLHHTPIMWLTFAYWGAALSEPRPHGSLLKP